MQYRPNPGPDVPETIYVLTPPCGGFPVAAIASRFTVTEDGRWLDTRSCSTCGARHKYAPPAAPALILCVLHGPPDEDQSAPAGYKPPDKDQS